MCAGEGLQLRLAFGDPPLFLLSKYICVILGPSKPREILPSMGSSFIQLSLAELEPKTKGEYPDTLPISVLLLLALTVSQVRELKKL